MPKSLVALSVVNNLASSQSAETPTHKLDCSPLPGKSVNEHHMMLPDPSSTVMSVPLSLMSGLDEQTKAGGTF